MSFNEFVYFAACQLLAAIYCIYCHNSAVQWETRAAVHGAEVDRYAVVMGNW